jgi:2,4-dienoyl-CoA reductase (NADPH2)
MGSMHTGLENSAKNLEKLTAFYVDRAKGGVGLIITGGFAPNRTGWLVPFSGKLTSQSEVRQHRKLTDQVHAHGAAILLQILHGGRYSYHPLAVAPSAIKSPISPFKPWKMSESKILSTIEDFANCAVLAQKAGYDGVEVMGSEGYLLNQFLSPHTNKRTDRWGGSFTNRIRFATEVVSRIREKTGPNFVLMYRLSLLDLVEGSSTADEMLELGRILEKTGVTVFNSGIGWHESRVPTIATSVPRAAFRWATKRLKEHVTIPVVAVNRINTPEVAEEILAQGFADFVSMARPLLADADFAQKALQGHGDQINTCIACNQGCLDQIFQNKRATCLVNPRACYEQELPMLPTTKPKKIAVVGAGPAGLSFSVTAAQRGHKITIFDGAAELGGQFNLAKRIPGKAEFEETIRYYTRQLQLLGVNTVLQKKISAQDADLVGFDEIVVATGIRPRKINTPGFAGDPRVLSYLDVISAKVTVGPRVAIIGAGGIGFDTALFLSHPTESHSTEAFLKQWGVTTSTSQSGSLVEKVVTKSPRTIYLMQRSPGKLGANLGKTTGWIHRATLIDAGVQMLSDIEYQKLDKDGLHILHNKKAKLLEVDHIVVCAGQEPEVSLANQLRKMNQTVHVIGGALAATELDAKRAIYEGTTLAIRV